MKKMLSPRIILFLLLPTWIASFAQTDISITTIKDNPSESIAPLVEVTWGQSCRYNSQCPVDSAGSCYHSRTGCGATAMAMLMKYWEYPVHGIGNHAYDNPPYGMLSADFENTYYDWENMPVKLLSSSTQQEIDAVAELMYHCGIAADMWYTTNASYSDLWDIRNALINRFDFSSTSEFLNRNNFSDSVWTAMMKKEVDEGRPVIYGFSGGSSGHFALLDGYSNDSVFHFNWGDATTNGYFKTFDELPVIQEVILGIQPNIPLPDDTTFFVSTRGIFNDGSNAGNYANNQQKFWLIQPPNATQISLMFSEFITEYEKDIVNIYDGENSSAPLLGSFSGSNLPEIIQTSGGYAFVEFVTDDTQNTGGWELHYTCTKPGDGINGMTVLTDATNTFDDGSGGSNYVDDANRYWLINPDTASHITLHFNSFYTETDWDYLYVYEGDNPAPENLLGSFTGNALPTDIISRKGSMLLHFQTDWNTNKSGWEVTYTAGFEKIELDVKVFLEGAWDNGQMTTALQTQLPAEQPFDQNHSASWYYEGSELVNGSIPFNAVDWILLELRDTPEATMATNQTIVAQQAGFLLDDGSVVDIEGDHPVFRYFPNDSIYLVIRSRNHLAVMGSKALTESGSVYSYDFRLNPLNSFGGVEAVKEIQTGVWGLMAGDLDGNDSINTDDAISWKLNTGKNGYLSGDLNFDTESDNKDKNDGLLPNLGKACQVPE